MYKEEIKEAVVDVLQNRVSAIADCIVALLDEGYIPNKNKTTILNWSSILIDAYDNINILSKKQQESIDRIYNKVLKL
jgi:tRNA A37 threonylcarbamoyladenosine dehydratase